VTSLPNHGAGQAGLPTLISVCPALDPELATIRHSQFVEYISVRGPQKVEKAEQFSERNQLSCTVILIYARQFAHMIDPLITLAFSVHSNKGVYALLLARVSRLPRVFRLVGRLFWTLSASTDEMLLRCLQRSSLERCHSELAVLR
jgi:hypothetical protein